MKGQRTEAVTAGVWFSILALALGAGLVAQEEPFVKLPVLKNIYAWFDRLTMLDFRRNMSTLSLSKGAIYETGSNEPMPTAEFWDLVIRHWTFCKEG